MRIPSTWKNECIFAQELIEGKIRMHHVLYTLEMAMTSLKTDTAVETELEHTILRTIAFAMWSMRHNLTLQAMVGTSTEE